MHQKQTVLKQYIDNAYDAVGVLICIRLNLQNLRIMQKRRNTCLEAFMNATNMLLWPKYQQIMDLHVESLKTAQIGKLMPSKDVRPHYVCFLCATIYLLLYFIATAKHIVTPTGH